MAVVDGEGPRAEILSVSPEAARHGVLPGATAVHGRAACADLCVRPSRPALVRAAREALLDAALGVSPRAEPSPPGTGPWAQEAALVVDAGGVGPLFGSETGFAGALAERAARVGLPAVVAVAGSAGVARIAARRLRDGAETTCVIAPGDDASFLAPLPLDLLGPDDALAQALTRFGLRTVDDLLRIPADALGTRLGASVAPLLALARGTVREAPPAVPVRSDFVERMDLEIGVDRVEPLLFALRGMLSRLAERLDCRGLAFADLELRLGLDGGGRDARRVGIAAPTLDVAVILRLIALSLESRPPPDCVLYVRVATEGAAVRGDQLDFFRPAGPTPAVLSRTVAELTALCGSGRVGAPAVADTHRPDGHALETFRAGARRADDRGVRHTGHQLTLEDAAPSPEPTALAVRALRPPLGAQVRSAGGTPVYVRSALANGDVVHCAGPWRTTGHWWSETERYAFDHFDVQTSDGLVVRLRFDWTTRSWQIDAFYD